MSSWVKLRVKKEWIVEVQEDIHTQNNMTTIWPNLGEVLEKLVDANLVGASIERLEGE